MSDCDPLIVSCCLFPFVVLTNHYRDAECMISCHALMTSSNDLVIARLQHVYGIGWRV